MHTSCEGRTKGESEPLKVVLHGVFTCLIWTLEPQLKPSVQTVHIIYCHGISPTLIVFTNDKLPFTYVDISKQDSPVITHPLMGVHKRRDMLTLK